MGDQSHRGARAQGPFSPPSDRHVLELDEAVRGIEAMTGALPGLGFFRDSTRAASAKNQSLGNPGHFSHGVIIHPLPGVNWYKVQMGGGQGWISACLTSHCTFMPLGPRTVGMVGPNDNVIIFKPPGLNYGFIIGVMPPYVQEGSLLVPDWILQGSGSGLKREAGHKYPIKNLYKSGGVIDWSSQRPQDQTPGEQGWITPFGLAMTIDDYMIQLRVNEMAGLWMTLFDGWVRLAGQDLLVESSVHEMSAGDDEGESRHFTGYATYPHEALGQYAKGQEFTADISDQEAQYTSHRAKTDLRPGEETLTPVYRHQEFQGYLGQGGLRFVMKPAADSGSRLAVTAGQQDQGLFMESIGLDGAYSVVSAKSVHIGKRCRIVVPRVKNTPESGDGDDAEKATYKFSSLFGDGPDHKVGDVKVEGETKSMLKAAAVMDLIAYDLNWKALHPFHYHVGDYDTPQAGDGDLKTQESISYSAGFVVADPTARRLKIDHRYGEVEYFERESFIRFNDDGGVVLAGGAGETLMMAGGRLFLDAPLGVDVRPGGDFTVHATQIAMKSKGSMDFSSTDKDIRFKSEKNMQFLSGNSGKGGMLFECKGEGSVQQYRNNYGEDVRSSGIVFRAANSVVAMLGKDIYMRTGGADLGEGDILLDASQGKRRVQVFGKEFNTYTEKGVAFHYGPLEKDSTVKRSYYFGDTVMVADVKLFLGGALVGYSGGGGGAPGVIVDGGVYGTKSFATSGVMADKKGMFLGKVPPGFAGIITSFTNLAAQAEAAVKKAGSEEHKTTIVDKYYQENEIGDADTISQLQFSFRDPPGSPVQYKTDKFMWPESRWQQFVRFGLASGGVGWTEKPVIYQGQATYPWPGKQKWKDEPTLLQLTESTMFDVARGVDQDRPGSYEDPALGELTPVVPDGEYKLIR